jgi:excisionase family DNA binding protein
MMIAARSMPVARHPRRLQRRMNAPATRPFSPETLANRWGCSSEKVRQMCRGGELASFRLGKLIRIPASEVERIECLNEPTAAGDSSDTADNGASPTDLPAGEFRLARMIGPGRKLSLVRSGGS